MHDKLKEEVYKANIELENLGLVTLTWGNVSSINRREGLIVIKPSGIDYKLMKISDMVVIDLAGNIVEGNLKPSTDSMTHIELYKAFPNIGGVTHTHSTYATIFAQACKEIPCFGTTHADHFKGIIPVSRFLSRKEVEFDYEKNTGLVIIERFSELDPKSIPGILVAGHAPFCWGINAHEAVKNSLILEKIAEMAFGSYLVNPLIKKLPKHYLEKHFQRKHGPDSYYGQK